ncbi:MAG: MFS transporter [Bdellovibrionales bacterium]|nr:MFS transporter [Bdellovibrionales bacterium]
MVAPKKQRRLSAGWTLFILTGLNLFNYLDRFVLSGVLTPLKEDLQLTDGQLGRIATTFMIGYFATSPLFGYLGDRLSRKWLIALGIFVWSLGTVLSGFATGFAALVGFRILVGVGEASYAAIGPSVLSDTFSPAKRNWALTVFSAALPVGAALGYVVGGQVAAHHGWRHAFLWAGAPGLLLALVLLPFGEPVRGESEGRSADEAFTRKPGWSDVLNLFSLPEYRLICAGGVAYTFALGAYGYWGPTFLVRMYQMTNQSASTFFGVVLVVAGLVSTMLGGWLGTYLQQRTRAGYAWLIAVCTLMAVPITTMAFLSSTAMGSMTWIAVGMFLLFLPTGPMNTMIIEAVPPNLRSSSMALYILLIHLFGDMWSPEIVGRVADLLGSLQKGVLLLPSAILSGALVWVYLALRIQRQERQELLTK